MENIKTITEERNPLRSLDFKKAKNKQKPSLEAQKWAFLCKFLKILSVYSLHTFTYGV